MQYKFDWSVLWTGQSGEWLLSGLIVTLDVTEEILAPDGFSIQLNGYGPSGASCVWQQYIVGVSHDPARQSGSSPLGLRRRTRGSASSAAPR